jgi:type III restriction enzyme
MENEKSPILNNPYEEPKYYYDTDLDGNLNYEKVIAGRRPYTTDINILPTNHSQTSMFGGADFESQDINATFINGIREEVKKWRLDGYQGTTRITKELLDYWFNNDERQYNLKLFYCQREAIETAVWLNEVAEHSNVGNNYLQQLQERRQTASISLNDILPRTAFKMATGTGKTVVMAMLILYNYLNKREYRNDIHYADHFLIVAPGITIRDRLGVLKIDEANSMNDKTDYYHERGLIPHNYENLLGGLNAVITITNYQQFEPKTYQGKKSSPMDGKLVWKDGEMIKQNEKEDFSVVLSRILGKQMKGKRYIIINDEAHHCYLPKQDSCSKKKKDDDTKDTEEENQNAMVWYEGLRQMKANDYKINNVYDLSATPYYLKGSGHEEYSIFPWVVTDFGLVEAIESGLVKIPFLPLEDVTHDLTEPKLRNIYEHIRDELPKKGQRKLKKEEKELNGGNILMEKPPVLPTLLNLALEQFTKDYEKYDKGIRELDEAKANVFTTPPVFIIVCNNTTVSKEVYKYIAGYETSDKDGNIIRQDGTFEIFSNYKDGFPKRQPPTLLIDSTTIDDASKTIDDDFKNVYKDEILNFKKQYASQHGSGTAENITDDLIMREVVNTVGKPGMLGANIRCVVSVSMLTEGWDANTVTHVCGIRAFGSQLLCEQVAGRALRRRSYDLQAYDARTGDLIDDKKINRYKEENILYKFPPEYAHIIGIPFKTFKGGNTPPPSGNKPKQEIKAIKERKSLEITFPNVIGYRSENENNTITADYSGQPKFKLDFNKIPIKTILASAIEETKAILETEDYHEMRDAQVIYFLTKQLIDKKYTDSENGRHFEKFAQLKKVVELWYSNQIELLGAEDYDMRRLVALWNSDQVVNSISEGIRQANTDKEKVTAILNYYNPIGSSSYVHGFTTKDVYPTIKSHVNFVVADTDSWEQIAAKTLEELDSVECYVKNHFLDFKIPYVTTDGKEHNYVPDFIAKIKTPTGNKINLIIEISGFSNDRTGNKDAKRYYVEHYWLPAVNNIKKEPKWDFIEITDIDNIKMTLIEKIKTL